MPNPEQEFRARDISTGAALSVDLDTTQEPCDTVEVFVKSNLAATFELFGSFDDITYRKTGELSVVGPSFESHSGFLNAYRYLRVSTAAAQNNVIEIVANRS